MAYNCQKQHNKFSAGARSCPPSGPYLLVLDYFSPLLSPPSTNDENVLDSDSYNIIEKIGHLKRII